MPEGGSELNLRSIRVRMAVWYLAVLSLCLILFGGGIYLTLRESLIADLEGDLRGHVAGLNQALQTGPSFRDSASVSERLREYASGMTAGYTVRVWGGYDDRGLARPAGDPSMEVLYTSPGFPERDVPGAPAAARFRDIHLNGRHARTLLEPIFLLGRKWVVEVAAPMELIDETLSSFRSILLSFVPTVLLVACLGGYWLSRRAMAPVARLTQEARAISVDNLGARLEVPETGDELQQLSETLNDVFRRLDDSVRRITQFTADVSHELRTPLTLVYTGAELALRRDRDR